MYAQTIRRADLSVCIRFKYRTTKNNKSEWYSLLMFSRDFFLQLEWYIHGVPAKVRPTYILLVTFGT